MEVEENKVYNGLYPAPNKELAAAMRKYLSEGCKMKLGVYCEVEKEKKFYPLLIKRSLQIFDERLCDGECGGNHKVYTIAGGYAAYLRNLTSSFSDIDIYVHCKHRIDQNTIDTDNYKIKVNRNVSTIISKKNHPNVQFIQVNFGLSGDNYCIETLRDMMAVYVIHKFDLPICRVAMRINLNLQMRLAYIIDASALEGYKLPSRPGRKEKYEARRNKALSVIVPSLQLSVFYNLVSKLCPVFVMD